MDSFDEEELKEVDLERLPGNVAPKEDRNPLAVVGFFLTLCPVPLFILGLASSAVRIELFFVLLALLLIGFLVSLIALLGTPRLLAGVGVALGILDLILFAPVYFILYMLSNFNPI